MVPHWWLRVRLGDALKPRGQVSNSYVSESKIDSDHFAGNGMIGAPILDEGLEGKGSCLRVFEHCSIKRPHKLHPPWSIAEKSGLSCRVISGCLPCSLRNTTASLALAESQSHPGQMKL